MKLRATLYTVLILSIGVFIFQSGDRSPHLSEVVEPSNTAKQKSTAKDMGSSNDESSLSSVVANKESAKPKEPPSAPKDETTDYGFQPSATTEMEHWLSEGRELATYKYRGSKTKQTQVRLIEIDFKYPLIRVEETTKAGPANGANEPQREIDAMVADHLIVSFKADTDFHQVSEIIEAEGFSIREQLSESSLLVAFEITENRDDLRYVQERLSDYSNIMDIIEPDYIVQAHTRPANRSLIDKGQLWGLQNTGWDNGQVGADIDAIHGWDIRSGAANTVVAVIDTGLRLTHEALAPNLWHNPDETINGGDDDKNGFDDDIHGYDFWDNDADPSDHNGHGTHVAGIIGADDVTGNGLIGVAWDVQLMALRFLGPRGYGTTSDAIKCIDYARSNGARILNNSWGGAGYSKSLEAAIERANADGCIFVASAGNSNRDIDVRPQYPAAYSTPNIVSVGATNSIDEPTFFTCRGKRKVDIAAPGQDILSAGHHNDSARRRLSGTSMAAPFVSGILALLDAEFPNSPNSALVNRLYRGAEPLDEDYEQFWSTGARANLLRALQSTSDRPANDNRADAYRSEHSSWSAWEIDTAGASFEPETPYTPDPDSTGDLWFEFTALSNEVLHVSTAGSEAAVRCHVLDAATARVLASTNDTEAAFVPAQTGDRFLIAVETIGSEGGLLALDLRQAPENDKRAKAFVEEGLYWETEGENGGASLSLGEDDRWGFAKIDRTVWWEWQAPRDGRFTLSTEGSNFDTVLSVHHAGDEFFLEHESTHLIFAIDRSAITSNAYRTSSVYDANNNGVDNEIIDQQIAAIISTIRHLRFRSLFFEDYDESLQVAIIVFDESAEYLDLDPNKEGINPWAYVSDFLHEENSISHVYTALRGVTASEVETVNYNTAFERAESLLLGVPSTSPRLVVMTPGQNIADLDYQASAEAFRQNDRDFAVMAPSIVSDISALEVWYENVLEYAYYREVSSLMRRMIATSDDAYRGGLWSRASFRAEEGKTYHIGVAGYLGEYGKIELLGRDPVFPFITEHPESTTVHIGERAYFEVVATGQQPLLYQWYKDGEPIAGAYGSSYSIWSTELGNVGQYHVTVTNTHGEARSNTVQLQTIETAPRFTFIPQTKGFIEGEDLRLLSATTGTQPITYQWYHDGVAMPEQTNAILNIASTTAADVGTYHVVASNAIGSTRSSNAVATMVSGDFDKWKIREGNPGQENLNGVAYGQKTFVAVGDSGRIMLSYDGKVWQRADIQSSPDLTGVAFGRDKFIAAGPGGVVYLAESPSFWEPIEIGTNSDWQNVHYLEGGFWLSGKNGAMARSLDGRNWEMLETGSTANITGLAWGHDGFLAVSDTATYLTSIDGINWTERTALNGETDRRKKDDPIILKDVAYFDGNYYVGNNYNVTASKTAEIPPLLVGFFASKPTYFAKVSRAGELLCYKGYNRSMTTNLYRTGEIFLAGGGGNTSAKAVTYGQGFYVGVGFNGNIVRSLDGIKWENSWLMTRYRLHDLVYAKDRYIATNRHGAIFTSPDGLWWETVREKYWSASLSTVETFIVSHGEYIYVISPHGDHARTRDGILWEWFNGDRNITSVVSYGSKLFYTTSANLFESPDLHGPGSPVFETSLTSPNLTYGNGIFLLRASDVTRYSNDGVNWSDVELTGDYPTGMLVAKDGLFLSQNMRWSNDGIHWETAGVMKKIPAEYGEISYKVADAEYINWASGGHSYSDWPRVPDDTIFGYDLSDQLSFDIPESGNLAEMMHGQYSSLYIRYNLSYNLVQTLLSMELRTRFNDGFLVYMGNKLVAGAKAAETSVWDSLATGTQTLGETEKLNVYDLTAGIDFLPSWSSRVVAFQVLNHAIDDDLFLFDFELYGKQRLNLENVFVAGDYFFGVDPDGSLYVSNDALDWVSFEPETGVLNKIISSPAGYTAVSDYGSVYQTEDPDLRGAQVYLRQPSGAQTVSIGEVLPLEVEVFAPSSEITDVTFYAGDRVITSLSESPYRTEWKPNEFGRFELYAVATTAEGLKSVSERIEIQVTAIEPWKLTSGNGEPRDLNAMEWIDGRWLATGDSGKLYHSTDGIAWNFQKLPTEEDLLSITEAPDGTLVIGGSDGGIFVSYDGSRNWVEEARYPGQPLKVSAYAFGRFYFAALGKIFMSSPDYQDWSITQNLGFGTEAAGLVYGDGHLMLAWAGLIHKTSNGDEWTEYTGANELGARTHRDLDYHDGAFYLTYNFTVDDYPYTDSVLIDTEGGAIARLGTSQATVVYSHIYGQSTRYTNDVYPIEKLHFTEDGRGLFLGGVTARYDPAMLAWTTAHTSTINNSSGFLPSTPASYLTSHGNVFWIVYGEREPGRYSPEIPDEGRALYSVDGLTWQGPTGGLEQEWSGVTTSNGKYFAFGNGGSLFHSADATNWTFSGLGIGKRLQSIDYGNGVYVTVGNDGLVASSSDLLSWQIHNLGTDHDFNSVLFANGQFIAAGSNVIYKSTDGIHWTAILTDYPEFALGYEISKVRHVNGKWALVGLVNGEKIGVFTPRIGMILLSENDGQTWTEMPLPNFDPYGEIYDLFYQSNQYLLYGSGSVDSSEERAWMSNNMTDWAALDLPIGHSYIRDITQTGGSIYVQDRRTANGWLQSEDLLNWNTRFSGMYFTQAPVFDEHGMIVVMDRKVFKHSPAGDFVQVIRYSQVLDLDFITVIDGAFWAIEGGSRIYKIEANGQRTLQLSGGQYLAGLVKEHERFFALSGWGNFAPITSLDGINWNQIPLSEFAETVPDEDLPKVQKILHDGTQYMAICRRGGGGTIYEYVCTSTNGLDWNYAFPIHYSSQYSHFTENGVYYKNSRNVLQQSADFQNWEVVIIGDNALSTLGETNGRFFFNKFYTDDFINWYPTEGLERGFDFAYSNGVYLALDGYSHSTYSVSISEDGQSWGNVSSVGIDPAKLLATDHGFVGLTSKGEIYTFPLRDLAVTQLDWPTSEYGPGDSATGVVTVENTGKLPWSADKPLQLELWLTQSGRLYGRKSFVLANSDWTGTLQPGSRVEIPINVTFPDGLLAGEYRSAVVIDPTRNTEDYNRRNNTLINFGYDIIVPEWSVQFDISGGGAVLSRDPGSQDFVQNASETFVPVAQKGYLFGGWQNQEDPGLGPLTLTFNQNHQVEAVFNQAYEIDISTSGMGSVTSSNQSELMLANSTVELSAIAETGWRFEKWTGDLNSTANPLTLQITRDRRLKARFIPHGSLDYENWAAVHAETGKEGPLEHGSGNNRENILNYFLGSQNNGDAVNPYLQSGMGGLSLRVPWNPQARNVGFEVLYSDDLTNWIPLPLIPKKMVFDGHDYLEYIINPSIESDFFFRVEVYEAE